MDSNLHEYEKLLSQLCGEQLSSVCFVQDYLQLDFDGYKLTAYIFPLLIVKESILEHDNFSYKNMLCDFIAKRVSGIQVIEKRIKILFLDTEDVLQFNLREGEDNIYYSDYEGKWFVL